MKNTISILGSTGSIGRQTLEVAEEMGLRVAAITAHSSVERTEAQARQFKPRLAVMTDEAAAKELAKYNEKYGNQ
jgi:1-deoxy-D-xylulose-5-phosphate reductoisomerase